MAPELQGLYRRLSDAEEHLQEWHNTSHVPTKSELCKVQHALSHVDDHYHEGFFRVNGKMPDGQAVLASKLHHAHGLLREFEINAA